MFEVIAIWDGQIFMHQALTLEDAKEWFACYVGHNNCTVRLWDTCPA
jgi:hypothetical protein